MRWWLFGVLLSGGALFAQDAPTIQVTALGGANIGHGATIPVSGTFTLSDVGIIFNVNDPQMDPVSISATVSNLSQAANWSEANFSKPATPTPYQHQVQAASSAFGPVGTVYIVDLTLSDGANTTTFGFAIKVENAGTGSGGDSGGSGGCTAGVPSAPMLLVALAAWRRRSRRKATNRCAA
jgi:hypothetical protein